MFDDVSPCIHPLLSLRPLPLPPHKVFLPFIPARGLKPPSVSFTSDLSPLLRPQHKLGSHGQSLLGCSLLLFPSAAPTAPASPTSSGELSPRTSNLDMEAALDGGLRLTGAQVTVRPLLVSKRYAGPGFSGSLPSESGSVLAGHSSMSSTLIRPRMLVISIQSTRKSRWKCHRWGPYVDTGARTICCIRVVPGLQAVDISVANFGGPAQ
jgi:hypothetical protein